MNTTDAPRRDQKNRFQFRLRTVLLLMMAAAILLAVVRRMPIELLEITVALLATPVGTAVLFLVMWSIYKCLALSDANRRLPVRSMLLTSMSGTIIILA